MACPGPPTDVWAAPVVASPIVVCMWGGRIYRFEESGDSRKGVGKKREVKDKVAHSFQEPHTSLHSVKYLFVASGKPSGEVT